MTDILSLVGVSRSLQVPLEDIVAATNNFSVENLINEGGISNVYRGRLFWSGEWIDVAVRRFYSHIELDKYEFLKEIRMLSIHKHNNMATLVGFCIENGERIMIMEYAVNGSLDNYLGDPSLKWSQRLKICLGAAIALSYIHNDIERHHSGFHHDIKSSKILLDKNWEAKVFCFGFRIAYPVVFYHTSIYTDPEYTKTGYGTHISDVYSFGMILFEVLCGRKGMINGVDQRLAPLATQHYEDGKLNDLIDPYLKKHMHPQSLAIFSEIAYNCLKERLEQRPDMKQIVIGIEEALDFQLIHENLEKHFADLKIPLGDIMLATENFANKYCIGSQSDGMLYKSALGQFDSKNKDELPKIPVYIKRIISGKYKKVAKSFFSEIEMLTRCKHPNIVPLIGFSWEGSEVVLVYECPVKGSLDDLLGNPSKMTNFNWEQRIRTCIDIAHGLKHLHSKSGVIHLEIQSANVMLGEKWIAKIATFRIFKYDSKWSTINTNNIGGTEYLDIYSFGVVLFEILFGRLANDSIFMMENNKGLGPIARRHFKEGTLKKMVDTILLEEAQEYSFTPRTGPNQDSLDTFSKLAYQCLEDTGRPTMEVIIKSLERALQFQVENFNHLKIPFRDIVLATENFDEKYRIGFGGYGVVYKATLNHFDRRYSLAIKFENKDEFPTRRNTVAIKRILRRDDGQGKQGFLVELEVLCRCEHPNVVSLLGFCVEGHEMILVYELASNGSLDDYLGSEMTNLSWAQRLKICLDIAYGLDYLHKTAVDKKKIIHRDIKSANILLGNNWEAKIADFGLSKFHPWNQQTSTVHTDHIAGTEVYLDPEYLKTGKLKKESDIYSFGVVLFEILFGKLAYDRIFTDKNDKGLAPIARQRFNEETLKEMIDPKIMEEAHELSPILKVGPNQDSLDVFSKVAYQCVAEMQVDRPKMDSIINELKRALNFQENRKDTFKFTLDDIKLGTENFGDNKCIIKGGFGMVYDGAVQYDNADKKVTIKRFSRSACPEYGLLREYEILFKHKHENVIGLVGYCKESEENIIVYEHASKGCLSRYLNYASLTWAKRLKICIDIANGLNFLHRGGIEHDKVIHRDLKSSNILLTEDLKAKICGFELSLTWPINQEFDYVINDVVSSPGYCDPLYLETYFLTKESDIYSFGVILFEILCGRLACPEDFTDNSQFLDVLVQHHYSIGRLEEIVFEGIKEHIVQKSLATFRRIALQCLDATREERPTAGVVVAELQKALEFQESYHVWEAKLPRNYRQILEFSKSPEIYSKMEKNDIYNILSKGILLQDGKMWFLLGDNGEMNEIISARMLSYKNRWSRRWQSIPESRFQKVAEILDILNLNIQINRRTQLLLLGISYSVHLVFKFCCPRKSRAKRMYVNLKYKMGNENLNAYFATLREDGWMMIELCRFSNQKEETNFDVLLESFSRCYCDSRAIYIEGIQFQALDNVKQEEIRKSEKIQQVSNSEMDKFSDHSFDEQSSSSMRIEVPAEQVLFDTSKKKLSLSNLSFQSRSEGGGIKLQRQQVFRIKCNIDSQLVPPNTEGVCYLVFKLSESCSGLHCPVIIRDQSNRRRKETGILYFRSPSPWNLVATDRVPKKREDGWMEVMVGIFNSDCRFLNLKLITYEGTMSGLIVRGLEFDPC